MVKNKLIRNGTLEFTINCPECNKIFYSQSKREIDSKVKFHKRFCNMEGTTSQKELEDIRDKIHKKNGIGIMNKDKKNDRYLDSKFVVEYK